MESILQLNKSEREIALTAWLETTSKLASVRLQPMTGDASFRRYYRVLTATQPFVAMVAPAEENLQPFIAIAHALRHMGLHAPEIIAADTTQGFLLLTDFGDATLLHTLKQQQTPALYANALAVLAVIQRTQRVDGHALPHFTRDIMWQEWLGYKQWFLTQFLGCTTIIHEKALDQIFESIMQSALDQPQVFMHRDYHAANLMVLPNKALAVLDFQDAFIGPITYDLVSLLRDAYIAWPDEWVTTAVHGYWQQLCEQGYTIDASDFMRWFDWMGLERHLKILFTFARKHCRDQQSHYLQFMPRLLNYLCAVSGRYPECAELHAHLQEIVAPALTHTLRRLCVA